MRVLMALPALAGLAILTACGGEKKPAGEAAPSAAAPAAAGAPATPCATCKVITVTMTSNDKGNFFEPNDIVAKKGDVLRFTVTVGVHNVDFLPDSNTVKSGLPPASPLLQLPSQTYDIPLTFGEGKFYFQCDPHAALGMKGHVTVSN
ncbi:MAG: plastocyanin/azurin family copper-binding protein [Gemmatimonadales bacterium]